MPAYQKFNSFTNINQMVLKVNTCVWLCEQHEDEVDADIVFNFIPIKEIRLRTKNTVCGRNMLISMKDRLHMLL